VAEQYLLHVYILENQLADRSNSLFLLQQIIAMLDSKCSLEQRLTLALLSLLGNAGLEGSLLFSLYCRHLQVTFTLLF